MPLGNWEIRDFDACECGDYRWHHKNGVGACIFNSTPGGPHGDRQCLRFRIFRVADAIPPPYAALKPETVK